MKIKPFYVTIMLSILIVPSFASAEIIGKDFFDYPDGELYGKDGGKGWTRGVYSKTSWQRKDGSVNIQNGKLKTGYTSNITRHFSKDSADAKKSGKVYVGLDIASTQDSQYKNGIHLVNSDNKSIAFFGTDVFNDNGNRTQRWKISNTAYTKKNTDSWDVMRAVNNENIPRQFTEAVRIVAMIDLDNSKLSLWLQNDQGDFIENTPTATLDFRIDSGVKKEVAGITLGGLREITTDNLIVATTFSEAAIPEPATILILLGGSAGLIARRRKKTAA